MQHQEKINEKHFFRAGFISFSHMIFWRVSGS